MKLFGFTIVTNNTMGVIVDKAVSVGHFEDKIHDLQNRVDTLKVHKKTLMGDRERFEGKYERIKAYNGILQDESVRLKAEIQEITVSGGKGVAMMAKKIRTRDDIIENQTGIIKADRKEIEDQVGIILALQAEKEEAAFTIQTIRKMTKDQAETIDTKQEVIDTLTNKANGLHALVHDKDNNIKDLKKHCVTGQALVDHLEEVNKDLETGNQALIDGVLRRDAEIERITKHDERSTKLFNNISMAVLRRRMMSKIIPK